MVVAVVVMVAAVIAAVVAVVVARVAVMEIFINRRRQVHGVRNNVEPPHAGRNTARRRSVRRRTTKRARARERPSRPAVRRPKPQTWACGTAPGRHHPVNVAAAHTVFAPHASPLRTSVSARLRVRAARQRGTTPRRWAPTWELSWPSCHIHGRPSRFSNIRSLTTYSPLVILYPAIVGP